MTTLREALYRPAPPPAVLPIIVVVVMFLVAMVCVAYRVHTDATVQATWNARFTDAVVTERSAQPKLAVQLAHQVVGCMNEVQVTATAGAAREFSVQNEPACVRQVLSTYLDTDTTAFVKARAVARDIGLNTSSVGLKPLPVP